MKLRMIAAMVVACGTTACGGDDDSMNGDGDMSGDGDGDMVGDGDGDMSGDGDGDMPAQTLCAKYGGADNVAAVVQTNVIGEIAADCRINTFFTSLSTDAFTRVNDCLTIQVQELFGCEGISYAGAMASNGLECRSMAEAHEGLGISDGDFGALIEDVVAGLQEAGVEQADIDAAAPALLGMQDAIVEDSGNDATTQMMCAGGSGGM